MRRVFHAMLAGLLTASAHPLLAADVNAMEMAFIRMPISPTGADLPNDKASLGKISQLATCLVDYIPRNDLSYPPESGFDLHLQFDAAFFSSPCARDGNYAQVAARFLRGAVAEIYLRHDFDLATGKPRRRPIKTFVFPSEDKKAALSESMKATLSFVQYGECVAKVDLPDLKRLFETEVGSDPESQAFAALAPAFGRCLTPGLTLKINAYKLRGYLAEGAYRQLAGAAQ